MVSRRSRGATKTRSRSRTATTRPVGPLVQAYLAAQPPAARRALKHIRSTIRTTFPRAVESFSYGIPGFRLDGRPLVWYAGWRAHVSLYPIGAAIRRAHAGDLEGCGFSKGTLRFPLDRPPSAALLKKIVKARAAEVRARRP